MPELSGAGAQPSGDAIAKRFPADNASAIGAGSINRPAAIVALALTYPYESAPPIVVSRNRSHASTLPQIAVITRLTRGSMIEALRSNHVRTARANGLPAWNVVVVHALRGALLPVVSYLGPAAAALLTGSVVVEQIFGIPGVGRYFVTAALSRDYTLVMGTVIVIAVFIIVFNLIVDLIYALIDPRIRTR